MKDDSLFVPFFDRFLGRRTLGRCFGFLLAILSVGPLAGGSFQAIFSASAANAQENAATLDASVHGDEGTTFVTPSDSLRAIIDAGEVPGSLEQLRKLEAQQQAVASRAEACTVNVQIGGTGHDAALVGSTQGCGAIITSDGYVLTAAHVAERPGLPVKLTLHDGRVVTARTLGMNRGVDAALIKIDKGQNDGKPWPHAALGSSEELEPGMWCIATGHPGGFIASRGFVTRVGRLLAVHADTLVTDCALIGGDSGGPLFDMAGRLIGIHSRIGNDVADNLHVPVRHYDQDWKKLVAGEAWGYLPGFRPVLGVRGSTASDVAEIESVSAGSPAEKAGIQSGDVINRFGDVRITDFESLKQAVAETMPGKRIIIELTRDNRSKRLVVEIGRDPRS